MNNRKHCFASLQKYFVKTLIFDALSAHGIRFVFTIDLHPVQKASLRVHTQRVLYPNKCSCPSKNMKLRHLSGQQERPRALWYGSAVRGTRTRPVPGVYEHPAHSEQNTNEVKQITARKVPPHNAKTKKVLACI